jgi:hypothetical protein
MPKRTRKYVAALDTAAGLSVTSTEDAETLYQLLNQKNFFWDATEGRWVPGSAPQPATDLIRIRVWAESSKVADVANTVVRRMNGSGFSLIEKSDPYMCRPPNQLESRIYLTFREDE